VYTDEQRAAIMALSIVLRDKARRYLALGRGKITSDVTGLNDLSAVLACMARPDKDPGW